MTDDDNTDVCPSCEGEADRIEECTACGGEGEIPSGVAELSRADGALDVQIHQTFVRLGGVGRVTFGEVVSEMAREGVTVSESRVARGLKRAGVRVRKGPRLQDTEEVVTRLPKALVRALERSGPSKGKALRRVAEQWYQQASKPDPQ